MNSFEPEGSSLLWPFLCNSLQITESEKGKPLPKYGEWDVNNPASADGFTVIFAKARDEKKGNNPSGGQGQPNKEPARSQSRLSTQCDPNKKKWLCCF
ncbi:protein NOI4-like [Salvia splendens]|uniref:protein NOI4-like n=1 Tax=Salvia splendens TaxID=180675 RepID=UPI001C280B62|nr:protein NOI4-like [Salvia splendens]